MAYASLQPTPVAPPTTFPQLCWCKMGGTGGRPQRGRLPPEPRSEKYFYGRGAPRGPRWPIKCSAAANFMLATAIRRQGIRTHQAIRLEESYKKGQPVGLTSIYEGCLRSRQPEWCARSTGKARIHRKGACARP